MRKPQQFGQPGEEEQRLLSVREKGYLLDPRVDPFTPELDRVFPHADRFAKNLGAIKHLTCEPGQSPGEVFTASQEYRDFRDGGKQQRTFQVFLPIPKFAPCFTPVIEGQRATLTSSGMTSIQKLPEVVQLGQVPMRIADALSEAGTANTTVRYIQENSFTNAADAVAENAAIPEMTWALSEVDAPVKKIGVLSRVSEELFADYAAISSYINLRLAYAVGIKEDSELLNGSGAGAHLKGLLNFAGIQTQAVGGNTVLDAIYKGIVKVKTNGWAVPSATVWHPDDWKNARLSKDSTGNFLFGNAAGFAYGIPVPQAAQEYCWGLPVLQTTNIAQGTVAVLSKLDNWIYRRLGLMIETTNSDASDFANGRLLMRATVRSALACYRPLSICTVTGIPVIP